MIPLRLIGGLAVLGLVSALYAHVYQTGRNAEAAIWREGMAETQRIFDKANAHNRVAAAQLEGLKTTQISRSQEAEHAANMDISRCRKPDARSLQRLKTRWNTAP